MKIETIPFKNLTINYEAATARFFEEVLLLYIGVVSSKIIKEKKLLDDVASGAAPRYARLPRLRDGHTSHVTHDGHAK